MRVYAFLGSMWALIILGGGLAVEVLGPLDMGPENAWLNSPLKATIAGLMVILWVFALARIKRYVFQR